jgi:hypothetical protein
MLQLRGTTQLAISNLKNMDELKFLAHTLKI